MTSFNAIAPIKAALLARPDAAFSAIDTLYRLFKGPMLHGELVAQMLQTEMITLLLGVLDGGRITVDGSSVSQPALSRMMIARLQLVKYVRLRVCVMVSVHRVNACENPGERRQYFR